MDPLSITSGVIAIIQIANTVISVCKDYVTSVTDAPKDLRTILIEVGSIKCVLETLELLVSKDDDGGISIILQRLQSSDGPLEGCKQALTALNQLLPAAAERRADGKRRKALLSLTSLAWPLKESKACKLLEDIGRHKTTISLALVTETVCVAIFHFLQCDCSLLAKLNGSANLNKIGMMSRILVAMWKICAIL
jgi:Fungal N-terminal domain of STAND proteins